MSTVEQLIGRFSQTATNAAAEVAAAKAEQQLDRFMPLIVALAFMAATTWVFYFLPRFRLPWQRA